MSCLNVYVALPNLPLIHVEVREIARLPDWKLEKPLRHALEACWWISRCPRGTHEAGTCTLSAGSVCNERGAIKSMIPRRVSFSASFCLLRQQRLLVVGRK